MPDSEILVLPESIPQDFVNAIRGLTRINPASGKHVLTKTKFAKVPDLGLDGALADIYTPTSTTVKEILSTIASKSNQGSTIICNASFTTLSPQQLVDALPRLWGSPYGLSLQRVIILNSKGFFRIIVRPIQFQFSELLYPIQTFANLREIWDDLDKEEAAEVSGR